MKSKLPPRRIVRNEYLAGATLQKMADRYGCCIKTMWCRVHGRPHKSSAETTIFPDRLRRMREMRTSGMTYREIGEQFGITRQATALYLKTHKHTFAKNEDSIL